ncbi:HNH endonuclease [Stenotrophomonas maltophilia]|uniref:HNH endonuclease n=1 Tax=Stenotrophomonas maltophilia TaxID=40324 RepID=UPI0013D9A759|nr:HNH endonuclease [Stenotrophomonas maltophilia]
MKNPSGICYLRGVRLKMPHGGDPIDDDCESLEHIIHNALSGTLSSRKILSHRANQNLNDLIDKEFLKIFEGFTSQLAFDRERPGASTAKGLHGDHLVDVIFKNDRFFPRKPYFDKVKRVIYANSINNGQNYKQHLLKTNVIAEEEAEDVVIYDDMAGKVTLPFGFDNRIFKQGFAKIAAGFAALNGVSRDNLKSVIDAEKESFRDKILLFPSLPVNSIEFKFEVSAFKSASYPVHALVLVGSRKERLLYCHVDLFSTFQWYVLLDDNYGGEDIDQSYICRLSDGSEIDFAAYFQGVLEGSESEELSRKYKRISYVKMFELFKKGAGDVLKNYNHLKFNSLSAFANYRLLLRKSNSLWGEK